MTYCQRRDFIQSCERNVRIHEDILVSVAELSDAYNNLSNAAVRLSCCAMTLPRGSGMSTLGHSSRLMVEEHHLWPARYGLARSFT